MRKLRKMQRSLVPDVAKIEEAQLRTEEMQRATEERLNALIDVVD